VSSQTLKNLRLNWFDTISLDHSERPLRQLAERAGLFNRFIQ